MGVTGKEAWKGPKGTPRNGIGINTLPFVGMPLWTLPKEAWTAHGVGGKSMSSASSGWGWWGLALQQSCTRQSPDWLQHVRGRSKMSMSSVHVWASCEVRSIFQAARRTKFNPPPAPLSFVKRHSVKGWGWGVYMPTPPSPQCDPSLPETPHPPPLEESLSWEVRFQCEQRFSAHAPLREPTYSFSLLKGLSWLEGSSLLSQVARMNAISQSSPYGPKDRKTSRFPSWLQGRMKISREPHTKALFWL